MLTARANEKRQSWFLGLTRSTLKQTVASYEYNMLERAYTFMTPVERKFVRRSEAQNVPDGQGWSHMSLRINMTVLMRPRRLGSLVLMSLSVFRCPSKKETVTGPRHPWAIRSTAEMAVKQLLIETSVLRHGKTDRSLLQCHNPRMSRGCRVYAEA
jgi:hypothetical protein